MDYNKKVKAAQKIHEQARQYRGRFLNSVAVIERDIALILTDYFCSSDSEKREIFYRKIATASFFTLNNKMGVLMELVKKDYPRYWDDHGQILKDLQKVMEFRNKLAHSVVDVSEDALNRPLEDGIGFVEWEKGEPITDIQFQEWEIKATMVSECLGDIKRLLPFKETNIRKES